MKNKFVFDAEDFPTDFTQVAYIEGRTEGIASDHLRSRVGNEARDPLTTADKVFKYLIEIFRDYNL